MSTFHVGDAVEWKWGNGTAEGTVKKVVTERIEITSDGKKIARNGTADNPALVIDRGSENNALKLASEIHKK